MEKIPDTRHFPEWIQLEQLIEQLQQLQKHGRKFTEQNNRAVQTVQLDNQLNHDLSWSKDQNNGTSYTLQTNNSKHQTKAVLPSDFFSFHELGFSESSDLKFPLVAIRIGTPEPSAPTLALFGGVHGLERIGSQVVLALLKSFSELLLWDQTLHFALQKMRVVFFPIVNPIGVINKTRCNPMGVDLMRNAPVDAEDKTHPLLGGHRISPRLPWYRGHELQTEAKAVIELCQQLIFRSQAAISVDFHSGFGVQDQIWFPYAKSKKPFPHIGETHAWTESFNNTHPNHFYRIEPQAHHYTTHGDLWDYIYDQFRLQSDKTYLPLCLEMGSWLWVRKNPLQVFSLLGPFNPIKPHRQRRILRRHQTFFDFMIRSLVSHQHWSSLSLEQKHKHAAHANELWYQT